MAARVAENRGQVHDLREEVFIFGVDDFFQGEGSGKEKRSYKGGGL